LDTSNAQRRSIDRALFSDRWRPKDTRAGVPHAEVSLRVLARRTFERRRLTRRLLDRRAPRRCSTGVYDLGLFPTAEAALLAKMELGVDQRLRRKDDISRVVGGLLLSFLSEGSVLKWTTNLGT
tara:strand:+ start:115 stop:486 length:372 start_codon:yes stop_codon:yes gene_type:complete